MANINDNVTVNATVNGSGAINELEKLQKQAKTLREELVKAFSAGDTKKQKELQKTLRQTNADIKEVQRQMFNVDRVLKNLSSASVKELQQAYRKLNAELSSGRIARGSREWEQHTEQIRRVNAELQRIRAEQNQTQTTTARISGGFKRFGGAITGAIASVTGLTFAVKKAIDDASQMDDVYSDVMKTTGMTRNQVLQLNESFMAMDTRTSREQLNALAATAGKLGITSQSDVLQFVEAANQINVALGEDLGEDAIKQIGKMVGVFGECTAELQGKDLKGQILSVGSALNELGATSSASEDYLVQFAARLGGTARQAGISMDNILGFASALDQDMQQVEMSATAFQNVLVKMMSEPAKFAKIAKMDVGEFTNLVKTDANTAMIRLLQTLKQTGDFEALTPVLKEMGLSGSRATGVLTSMANSVDKITEAQSVANRAISEGISITNEYNTKNNNLEAQMEKARKSFKDASIALGESLAPIMLDVTSTTTKIIQALSQLVPWLKNHMGLVTTVASAWGLYVAAKNKALIIGKAKNALTIVTNGLQATAKVVTLASAAAYNTLAGNQTRAAAASKMLKVAMASTPWGAILTAVVGIGAAIYKMATNMTATEKAMKGFREETAKEEAEARYLFDRLGKLDKGSNEYRETLGKLKALYPDIIKAHSDDKGELIDLKAAYDAVVVSIRSKVAAQMKEKTMTDVIQKDIETQTREFGRLQEIMSKNNVPKLAQDEIIKNIRLMSEQGKSLLDIERYFFQESNINQYANNSGASKAHLAMQNIANSAEKTKTAIAELDSQFSQFIQETTTTTSGATKKETGETTTGGTATADPVKDALATIENELAQKKALYLTHYAIGKKNKAEYEQALYDAELKALNDKRKFYDQGTKERADAEAAYQQKVIDGQRTTNAKSLDELKSNYDAKRLELKQLYIDEKIYLETYNEQLKQLEGDELKERVQLYKEGTDERKKAEQEYVNWLSTDQFNRQKNYEQQLADYKKNYSKQTNAELMNAELSAFEALCTKIVIAEEEKQKIIQGIREKYNNGLEADNETTETTQLPSTLWNDLFGNDIQILKDGIAEIDTLIANGTVSIADGMKQKMVLVGDFMQQQMQKFQVVISGITTLMSNVSQMVQAEYDLQAAKVEARYDKEIKAAGKNSKKVTQLEQQKQAEIDKIKAEANEKAFGLQVASAIAQTALAAISAYASASAIPIAGWILGPIAAGLAVAAGGVQIATIKKQHEASKANYWAGGFTPSGAWNQEQGTVHSDEFVANRFATKNPAIRPVLNLLDQAQKDNTVGNLTSSDVSRVLDTGGTNATQIASNDTTNLVVASSVDSMNATNDRLQKTLDKGIVAVVSMDGQFGIVNQQRRWNQLHANKDRK